VSPWASTVFNNANLGFARACLAGAAWFAGLPGAYVKWNPSNVLARRGVCRITAFDVGEGGALLIRTESRRAWLIDTGNAFAFRTVVHPGLQFHGVKRLDGLILSHGDHAHAGGAADALALGVAREIVASDVPSRSPAYRKALESPGIPVREAVRGAVIPLDEHTTVRILFPPADWQSTRADDQCLVARIEHRGRRLLVVNDAGFLTEKWLLANEADLACDVLVKGHHAADSSGSPEFLAAAKPGAIVCASAGFPAAARVPDEWRAEVEARGVTVFDQSETGAVEIESTGESVVARPYLGGPSWRLDAGGR
jgi:competence protein ComEC